MRGLFFLAPSLQASTLRSLRLLLPRCLFDRRWAAAANGFPATPKWPPHTRCMTRAAASRTACRHMLASLTPRSCISYTRAATSRVQHCWQRRSLLIVSLSYKLNMTCAAGAPTPPSTGRKPGMQLHTLGPHYPSTPEPPGFRNDQSQSTHSRESLDAANALLLPPRHA